MSTSSIYIQVHMNPHTLMNTPMLTSAYTKHSIAHKHTLNKTHMNNITHIKKKGLKLLKFST